MEERTERIEYKQKQCLGFTFLNYSQDLMKEWLIALGKSWSNNQIKILTSIVCLEAFLNFFYMWSLNKDWSYEIIPPFSQTLKIKFSYISPFDY